MIFEQSGAFFERIRHAIFQGDFLKPFGRSQGVGQRPGNRIGLDGGRAIHFLTLGNAPELH